MHTSHLPALAKEMFELDANKDTLLALIRGNDRIEVQLANAFDAARAEVSPEAIDAYFSRLAVINGVPAAFIINVDESGFTDWVDCRCTQVVTIRGAKNPTFPLPRSGPRCTVAAGISLSGDYIRPLVIVPTQTVHSELVRYGFTRRVLLGSLQAHLSQEACLRSG